MLGIKYSFAACAWFVLCLFSDSLDAQIASTKLEINRFQSGNILASTRETFFEIDIEGNKVQEFEIPRVVSEDEKTHLESIYGEGGDILCDADGVAWTVMDARRVEADLEKFVEWAYEGHCLASIDSTSGEIRLSFLHQVPDRCAIRIQIDQEDVIVFYRKDDVVKSIRVNKKTRETKQYVPTSGSKPMDFELSAIDAIGNRYRPDRSDFLIEFLDQTHRLSMRKDLGFRYLRDIAFHPSGKLILSTTKEVLITEPDPENGTLDVLHKIDVKSASYFCFVGEQNE